MNEQTWNLDLFYLVRLCGEWLFYVSLELKNVLHWIFFCFVFYCFGVYCLEIFWGKKYRSYLTKAQYNKWKKLDSASKSQIKFCLCFKQTSNTNYNLSYHWVATSLSFIISWELINGMSLKNNLIEYLIRVLKIRNKIIFYITNKFTFLSNKLKDLILNMIINKMKLNDRLNFVKNYERIII